MIHASSQVPNSNRNIVELFSDFTTNAEPFGVVATGGTVSSVSFSNTNENGVFGTASGMVNENWTLNPLGTRPRACVMMVQEVIANTNIDRQLKQNELRRLMTSARVKVEALASEEVWMSVGCVASHGFPSDVMGENGVYFVERGNNATTETQRVKTWKCVVISDSATIQFQAETNVRIDQWNTLEVETWMDDLVQNQIRAVWSINGKTVARTAVRAPTFKKQGEFAGGGLAAVPGIELRDKRSAGGATASTWTADWMRVVYEGDPR